MTFHQLVRSLTVTCGDSFLNPLPFALLEHLVLPGLTDKSPVPGLQRRSQR